MISVSRTSRVWSSRYRHLIKHTGWLGSRWRIIHFEPRRIATIECGLINRPLQVTPERRGLTIIRLTLRIPSLRRIIGSLLIGAGRYHPISISNYVLNV